MANEKKSTDLVATDEQTSAQLFKLNITNEVRSVTLPLTAVKPIASAADKDKAEALLQAAKKTRKTVADIRLASTRELDNAKAAIMNQEREFAGQLDSEIKRVEADINRWNNAELARVRAEQQKIKDDAAKQANRLRNESSIANHEIKTQAKVQEVQSTAPTAIATRWVFRGVIDQSKVPAEYLTTAVDSAKVQAAIKSGVTSIPGLDIAEEAKRTGR